ncbi:MAG: hypothetical protein A2X78_02935 [Gammaproteobacteria bacterium GWE2_37_16]|nr:MAG: hypothetical protein A2X78_02935 [Gammaproteobacteria bacterium GWE2_37_16]
MAILSPQKITFADPESQRTIPVSSNAPVASNSSWWKSLAKCLIILPVLPLAYFAGHLLQGWFGRSGSGSQPNFSSVKSDSSFETNQHELAVREEGNLNAYASSGSVTHVIASIAPSSLIDINSFDDGLPTFPTAATITAMGTAQNEKSITREEGVKQSNFITKVKSVHSPHFSANSLTDGLVASYLFKCNTIDESGNGNDGIAYNATYVSDQFGNPNSALHFDGLSTYVALGNLIQSQSFTFAMWIKTNTTQVDFATIIDNYHNNTINWSIEQNGSSNKNIYNYGYAGMGLSIDLSSNELSWQHIAVTNDGTLISVYQNGQLVGSQTRGLVNYYSPSLCLGAWCYGGIVFDDYRFWHGDMSDVRIYNRTLAAQAITSLYTQPALPDGTVIHYNFAGNVNGQNGVRDSSGFNNFANATNIDFSATDRFGHAYSAAGFPNSVADPALNPVITIPYSQQIYGMEANSRLSFSVWIYVNQMYPYGAPTFPIIDGNNYHWLLEVGANQEVCFSFTGDSGDYACSSNYHIQTLSWYHIVLTYSFPGTYNVLVNGNIVLSGTAGEVLPITNVPIYVGYGPTEAHEWANGKIADVRFYNYILTDTQISALRAPYPTVNNFPINQGGTGFLTTTDLYASFDASLISSQVSVTFSNLTHISLNPLTATLANLNLQYAHDCSQFSPTAMVTFCDPFTCGIPFPLSVSYTSISPTINTVLASQTSCCNAAIGQSYNFIFNADTFTGPCVTFIYTATLADGSSLPTWLTFNPTTRTFSGTPNAASQIGNLNLKVTATDFSSASVADTFNLNVIGTLSATNTVAPISYTEDTEYNLADIVITTPSLTVTTQLTLSNPVLGALSTATSGAVTSTYSSTTGIWQASGAKADVNTLLAGLKFHPALNKHDNFSVAVSITDGYGQVLTSTISATGIAVNDPPVVSTPIQSQIACCATSIGNAYSFSFAENTFTDIDGDALTYTATKADGSSLPTWLTFTPTTRTFSGTPNAASQIGNLNLKVTAIDSSSASVADTFNLNIIGTLSATNTTAPISYTEDTEYNLADIVITTPSPTVTAQLILNDPAAGILTTATYGAVTSFYNAATGAWFATGNKDNINTLLANLKYQPALHYHNAFSIAVSVVDSFGQNYTSIINAIGTSLTYAPVVTKNIAYQASCCVALIGENYEFTFASDSFIDPHGGTLTYTATQTNGSPLPACLNFNALTRTFTGIPNNANLIGNLNLKVTATNPESQSTSSIFSLNIAKTLSATNTAVIINYIEDTVCNLTPIIIATPSPTVAIQLTLSSSAVGALSTTTYGSITSTYNPTTGIWQASGTKADVNTLLADLKFNPVSNKYDNFSIAVSITDGYGQVLSSIINATGIAVNDPPMVNLPLQSQTACCNANIGSIYTFTFAPDTFTDVDQDVLTYTATQANGALLPVWLSFNPVIRAFSGTPYNASVIGDLSIKVTASDPGGASAYSIFSLQIAKTLFATNTDVAFIYTEDITQNLAPIAITTPSSSTAIQLTLSNKAAGKLSIATSGAVTSTYDQLTGVWRASGVPANVNALLATLQYLPSSNFNAAFSIAVNIADNYGQTITSTITVFGIAVDDPPELILPIQLYNYTKGDAPLLIAPNLTLTDADSTFLTSAVVSISNGFVPGDQLFATSVVGITLAQDLQHGTLTMVGLKAPTFYEQVLRTLTFQNIQYNRQHTKEITLEVSDQTSSNYPVAITINYQVVKMPPTFLTLISTYNTTVGRLMELDVACEDPNGDPLVATATNAPTWLNLALINSIMKLSGTAQMPPGTYAMQLTISNGVFNTSQALRLSVNQPIDRPDNNPIFYIVGAAGGGILLIGSIMGLLIRKSVTRRRLAQNSLYNIDTEITLERNKSCPQLVPSFEIRSGFVEYLKIIGKGSYAEVHKVKLLEHGNMIVALKKLKFLPTWSIKDKNDAISEFHTEVGLLRSLPHPNIISVYGCINNTSTSTYALAMEFTPEGSLDVFLRKNGKSLDLKQKLQIIMGIAQGLNYLHTRHVVHRDIKSLNILIFPGLVPKIIDFGFAHYFVFGNKELTPEELRVGSTHWVAPEILKGDKVEPYACDVYAFGIVMWEIISCLLPYQDIPPRQIQNHVMQGGRPAIPDSVPTELAKIITSCWSGNPKERPRMNEVIRVIARVLEEINAHQNAPAPRLDAPIPLQQPSILDASVSVLQPHKPRPSSKPQAHPRQQVPLSPLPSGSSVQMSTAKPSRRIKRQSLLGLNFLQAMSNSTELPLPPVPSRLSNPGGRSAFFAQSPSQLEMQVMTSQHIISAHSVLP